MCHHVDKQVYRTICKDAKVNLGLPKLWVNLEANTMIMVITNLRVRNEIHPKSRDKNIPEMG